MYIYMYMNRVCDPLKCTHTSKRISIIRLLRYFARLNCLNTFILSSLCSLDFRLQWSMKQCAEGDVQYHSPQHKSNATQTFC